VIHRELVFPPKFPGRADKGFYVKTALAINRKERSAAKPQLNRKSRHED
jgi:hypothetical protein